MEDDDFGLERRDGQSVAVAGVLRGEEEILYGGGGVGDETEIVDVEEYDDEGHEVGTEEGEVWVVPLDGVYEIGNVETPQEGGETVTLRETLVDVDVGVVVGKPVENTVHEGVVKSVDALPKVGGDTVGKDSSMSPKRTMVGSVLSGRSCWCEM